ncbi:LOB domain-containing protein [Actinidia chinensis var. chinensis]|uniref:LOB domain-containing protein n=1 Tax=Actinidia chinensis var. chinensis TaxID=1590841 RepID=A0A2R6R5R3_ACTCC|nr:LOB domain-containing protein [Actinidia chinensis var. chinensis]
MSSSNSPCAACKFLRRKCTQECVFAPYFPPDQPQKFSNVHKVFGASNVAKILNELNAAQREDAVNSLAYEAEARLRDPVYGCVGLISILQHKLKQIQVDLYNAKKELATYIGPSAMLPILQHPGFIGNNPSSSSAIPYNMSPMLGLPSGTPHNAQLVIRESQQPHHHHQQMLEAHQLAAVVAAREQQEMLRTYEQQQQELVRFNSGFDQGGPMGASGFNQMSRGAALSPSLALGSFDEGPYQIQQQPQEHSHPHELQLQSQLLLQQQQPEQPQTPQQQQRSGNEDGRSVGPSC